MGTRNYTSINNIQKTVTTKLIMPDSKFFDRFLWNWLTYCITVVVFIFYFYLAYGIFGDRFLEFITNRIDSLNTRFLALCTLIFIAVWTLVQDFIKKVKNDVNQYIES